MGDETAGRLTFFADTADYPYTPGEPSIYLGLDHRNREIGVRLERHALTIAGSGAGKGVGLIVPNGLRWADNLMIVEPKGESVAALWEAREAKGQKVVVLDPFKIANIPDRLRGSFNPLESVKITDVDGREHLKMIADGLVRRSDPRHEEWYSGAATILSGLLAYVAETAPPEHRNLTTLRSLLLQGKAELHADAQRMQQCTAFGRLARAAGLMIQTALETDKGMEKDFLGAAERYTEWLDSEPIAETLKDSSFDLSELKTGKISLFVILPPQYLETHAAYLRLFVRAAIEAMMKSGVRKEGRCLFMLDEFYSLGKLDIIAKSAGLMRDYGLHLWPIMQDIGQLRSLYTDISETFFANADAATFFGVSDQSTLEYISRKVGVVTLDDLKVKPPKRHKLVSDQMAAEAASPIMPPRPMSAPPTRNANTGALMFLGVGAMNGLNQTIYELQTHQSANLQAKVAALRDQEQRLDEKAMRDYHHEMQRRGEPRLTPDGVARLIGKGKTDTVAPALIAFLRNGETLRVKPHPFFLPKPPPPPHPTKGRSQLLNRQIEMTGKGLQTIFDQARARDTSAPQRAAFRKRRAFAAAGLVGFSAPIIMLAPEIGRMRVNWHDLPSFILFVLILAAIPALIAILCFVIGARVADWFSLRNTKNQVEQASNALLNLYTSLRTETVFDIDDRAAAAIPAEFKEVFQRHRVRIAKIIRAGDS